MKNFGEGEASLSQKKGVIRATFSLPENAIAEIDAIREKLARNGVILNKSEVVRAALIALEDLSDKRAQTVVRSIKRLKAGRPHLNK